MLTWYRAYDPDTGRWLSRDPIEEDGGINLYEYVKNEPLQNSDPLGQACYRATANDRKCGALSGGFMCALKCSTQFVNFSAKSMGKMCTGNERTPAGCKFSCRAVAIYDGPSVFEFSVDKCRCSCLSTFLMVEKCELLSL